MSVALARGAKVGVAGEEESLAPIVDGLRHVGTGIAEANR